MIGVFDSGRGGVMVARELLSLSPSTDLLLLSDRKNLPYGIKTDAELLPIVKENIKRLRDSGADAVLIGCCTASSIYTRLISPVATVIPIIVPTARRAAEITDGKICVIATASTVRSHAFAKAISLYCSAEIHEFAVGELVGITEGIVDRAPTKEEIKRIKKALTPVIMSGADTLVLGCTHFPIISELISKTVGEMRIVSCAKEGAIAALAYAARGQGRIIYTE